MIFNCQQRTTEWFRLRCGRVTASEVSAVMNFVWKGSKERGDKRLVEGADRANYRASLMAETMTGQVDMDGFNSAAMRWGAENEPLAISAYELRHGVLVDRVGFGTHSRIARLGASPDALVGDLGGFEVKCLKSKNHQEILKTEIIPPEYHPQIQTNIAVFERDWWDWGSFDPRMPEPLQLWDTRVYRDEAAISKIEQETEQFLEEMDAEIEWYRTRYGDFVIPPLFMGTPPEPEPDYTDGEMYITEGDIAQLEAGWQAQPKA